MNKKKEAAQANEKEGEKRSRINEQGDYATIEKKE